jgi:glycosyltransferase involved in cell wall biosynthesis
MSAPRVTVVIPAFNGSRYLRATLDAVFAQTYPHWEVVAVDDASTDDTVAILRSYGDRVRVIARSANSGTADIPRYEGVAAARTDLVALLDGDDLWLPEKLGRQVAFMDANPGIPLAHCYARLCDAAGVPGAIRHEGIIPPTGPCARELLARCFICTSAVMVRRADWLAAQKLEQVTTYGTEWDFFLSIARAHPIGFLPEPLLMYRVSGGSISRRNWKRFPRDVGAMERIYRKGLWEGVVGRGEMRRLIRDACLESADAHRDRGFPGQSLYFAAKALTYGPFAAGAWSRAARGVARALVPRRAEH